MFLPFHRYVLAVESVPHTDGVPGELGRERGGKTFRIATILWQGTAREDDVSDRQPCYCAKTF